MPFDLAVRTQILTWFFCFWANSSAGRSKQALIEGNKIFAESKSLVVCWLTEKMIAQATRFMQRGNHYLCVVWGNGLRIKTSRLLLNFYFVQNGWCEGYSNKYAHSKSAFCMSNSSSPTAFRYPVTRKITVVSCISSLVWICCCRSPEQSYCG